MKLLKIQAICLIILVALSTRVSGHSVKEEIKQLQHQADSLMLKGAEDIRKGNQFGYFTNAQGF